ncbi:MAG: SGNH/GDSL hydrolase family protein [Dehalococcoidia bacterium]
MVQSAPRSLFGALIFVLALVVAGCTEQEQQGAVEQAQPRYVAIGASDSVGTGARDPARDGWVPQLHARMPAGTHLVNLGVSGLRMHQALEQSLPIAVDLQPSVVTIWLAVNDLAAGVTLDSYQVDLDIMLATLRQQTQARVYVANLPDLTYLPAFDNRDRAELSAEVQRWNDAIAASVSAHDVVLVDLYSGWTELRDQQRNYVSRDGLHPTSRGYRRLAEIFWAAMQGT